MRSYRFALTPRWVAFHALVWLLLIPAFIGLGYWQRTLWKDRADAQGLVYAKLDAKPAALGNVDPLGHFVTQDQQWVTVTVTGHYDTAHQFAVRNRSQNENAGWYVVTPLVLDDGSAVLVNQGWIATSNSDVPSTAMPTLPPVPSGTVTVTGWLQPDETTANTRITDDTAKLPTGEIALITKPDLQSRVGAYQLHDGSIQLTSSAPANTAAAAAQPVPGPSYDNTMYIAYMIQWWVFAVVMPITWLKLLHREAQELQAKRQAALEEDDWDDEDDEDWDEESEDDDASDGLAAQPVAAAAAASEARQPGE